MTKIQPGRSSPGEMIEDLMIFHGMTFRQLASECELPDPFLMRLIMGSQGIDDDIACRLSRVLGYSSEFWLEYERQYRLNIT